MAACEIPWRAEQAGQPRIGFATRRAALRFSIGKGSPLPILMGDGRQVLFSIVYAQIFRSAASLLRYILYNLLYMFVHTG